MSKRKSGMEIIKNRPIAQLNYHLDGLEFIEACSVPEPNTGCWLWLGSMHGKYGWVNPDIFGEMAAHRYALKSKLGDIGDMWALHKCDQPSCVNPDHLYAGTVIENNQDKVSRGRSKNGDLRGEQLTQSKLTVSQVKFIRENCKARDPYWGFREVAKRMGVSKQTVASAFYGISWGHVK